MLQKPLIDTLQEISSRRVSPGGGSSTALSMSIGCATLLKVARLSKTKNSVVRSLHFCMKRSAELAEKDAESFGKFYRGGKYQTKEESINRARNVAAVPHEVLRLANRLTHLIRYMLDNAYKTILNDVVVGADMILASCNGSFLNYLFCIEDARQVDEKEIIETEKMFFSVINTIKELISASYEKAFCYLQKSHNEVK